MVILSLIGQLALAQGVRAAPSGNPPGVDLAEEAQVAFELGVQHVQRGEYLQGLSYLLESNRLAPNRNVLYNIAGAYEALGRLEQAFQYYTDYVALETDPEQRAAGQRGLDRLTGRVALVEIVSDPPGATIYVDRIELGARGATPRTVAVPPGPHTVLLKAQGYAQATAQATANRGAVSTVSLPLDRLTGTVRLFGEPAGAEIRAEGRDEVLGTLPATVEVPVGTSVLELVAPGYGPRKLVVEVQTDRETQVDGTLSLLTGRLVVGSFGRVGALIEVDGEAMAFTPSVVDVPVGTHEVRVTAPGYDPFVASIDITQDQATEIEARLRGNTLDPLVETASRTAELLSEAPVPVTVVTSEMIRAIGARTLKDVLEVYVPGMTNITDHNELNVAMRGIYASSQQKILVMVDGHRLNSRAYSEAAPDYSIMISPDRIRQIEILRGPGSAAYGNIAFTAVVNIITARGADTDAFVVSGGAGNHGQARGSIVYGGGATDEYDLLIWGQAFDVRGEEVPIRRADDFAVDEDGDGVPDPHAGFAIVGGATDPTPYDFGARVEVGDFHLFGNARYGHHVEPFTSAGVTGAVYDHGAMRDFDGVGPGIGSRSNHLEAGWSPTYGAHALQLTAYYDTNTLGGHTTTGWRNHLFLNWKDAAVGGIAQSASEYELLGEGTLLVGGQVEVMSVESAMLVIGTDGDWQSFGDTDQREVLLPGTESTYSAFVQLKHSPVDAITLNAGARFDYKVRREGAPALDIPQQDDIANLSPRVALVLHPIDAFSTKVSYGESFVDAPYWYRYNNLASYAGAVGLTPERLRALQVTPELSLLDGRLKSTSNVAYQYVYDFIFRDNNAQPGQPFYINAGRLETLVLEEELAFVAAAVRARANATYQHVLSVDNYDAQPDGTAINNVPSLVANAILDANPLYALDEDLWLNLTLRYIGAQHAPIRTVSLARPNLQKNLQHEEPAHLLVDVGGRVDGLLGGFALAGRVYNLFGTRMAQGGSTLFPYPQPGRWFLVNVEWEIDATRGDRG
jgi:outer membrane receptor for ferrienterochelin and colicins